MSSRYVLVFIIALALLGGVAGLSAFEDTAEAASGKVLYIGAIPDQDVSLLSRQFGLVSTYLSEATGIDVRFVPSVDYAALVTAFARGDIHLAWFGGLTGVQARAVAPGSLAIAQRTRDQEFHSVFIVRSELDVDGIEDLKGLTFTFGSESSTSGHLMPRYFLTQAGINPERDFRTLPNYSGSHDRTIALVESGAFQAGVLNEAVWEARSSSGKVDLERVRVFYVTPPYFDYHWTIRGDVDATFGPGTLENVKQALLDIDEGQQEILDLFQTDRFIETRNENYEAIREAAQAVGILR